MIFIFKLTIAYTFINILLSYLLRFQFCLLLFLLLVVYFYIKISLDLPVRIFFKVCQNSKDMCPVLSYLIFN